MDDLFDFQIDPSREVAKPEPDMEPKLPAEPESVAEPEPAVQLESATEPEPTPNPVILSEREESQFREAGNLENGPVQPEEPTNPAVEPAQPAEPTNPVAESVRPSVDPVQPSTAPVQSSAHYAPNPAQTAYARPTVPPTIDSARQGAAAYVPRYPTSQPETQTKKRSLGWVWRVIGLLVGFGIGFFTAKLIPSGAARGSQAAQQAPRGDLQQQIQMADDNAILTAPAQVYAQNVDSVVGIASESTQTNAWGQESAVASVGTGFIITADGYILTNYHVVAGNGNVTVMLNDGRELPAELVGYDSEICDLALLKIEAEGLQPVTFGDSDKLLIGEQVCAIGHPLGELTYTLTVGYVSAKDRIINSDGSPINMMQTDCTINSGNSGGPLFDMNGNVIGITTAKYSGTTTSGASVEGIGFAIPINDVVVLLDDLQTYGYLATQPYLGISVRVGGANEEGPAGAYINDTLPGYAAQAAGLKGGDILTKLGDYDVSSYNDLSAALRHYHAGDTVQVEVWRNGEYLTKELTLDARPHTEPEETEAAQTPVETFPGWSWSFP